MIRTFLAFSLISIVISVVDIWAQERVLTDSLFKIKPVGTELLPAVLPILNNSLSLAPWQNRGLEMHYAGAGGRFLPDMRAWQKNYLDDNNFRRILKNPTVGNGHIMGYAVQHKSQANMELYHSYMLMNQKMAGYDPWQGVGNGPKNIRYVNIVGLTMTGIDYMIHYINDPEFFGKQKYLFNK